jgi:hypothetical protein
MTFVEVTDARDEITQRQRYSHYFVIAYAIIAVVIGINLRDSALYSTVPYTNPQVGITAFYPQNWLLDSAGDYIFRVRDMRQPGFKPSIVVDIVPITLATTARNILDSLVFSRSQTFSGFDVLAEESIVLPSGIEATRMSYIYVESDADPFLESLPSIVEGEDIIITQGGQALVISFLADTDQFAEYRLIFDRFLNDLST